MIGPRPRDRSTSLLSGAAVRSSSHEPDPSDGSNFDFHTLAIAAAVVADFVDAESVVADFVDAAAPVDTFLLLPAGALEVFLENKETFC